jgi:hypothetical protein
MLYLHSAAILCTDFALFGVIGTRPFTACLGGQPAPLMRVHLSWVAFTTNKLKVHRKKKRHMEKP